MIEIHYDDALPGFVSMPNVPRDVWERMDMNYDGAESLHSVQDSPLFSTYEDTLVTEGRELVVTRNGVIYSASEVGSGKLLSSYEVPWSKLEDAVRSIGGGE
jgi:hypothetical protein